MIGSYSPWFVEELERRITAERVDRMTSLGADICEDHAAYRYACGFLAGLAFSLDIAEEIKKDIDKG